MKQIRIIVLGMLLIAHLMSQKAWAMSKESKELLRDLVAINTDSNNPVGLEQTRLVLADKLRNFGLSVRTETIDGRSVLIGEGSQAANVIFLGHIDTVFSSAEPTLSLTEDAAKFYGDGIIDMKGGLVLIFDVIARLSIEQRHFIKVILNDEEELGSMRTRKIMEHEIQKNTTVLVFEPGLDDGRFVSSQSGVAWYELSVLGRAAHAGVEPQNGYNACVELAYKGTHLHELNDFANGVSVTLGTMVGGTKPNIVCEKASARVDLRFWNKHQLERLVSKVQEITEKTFLPNNIGGFTPTFALRQLAYLPAFQPQASVQPEAMLRSVSSNLGIKVGFGHVGYGSDGGLAAEWGAHVLVGMGPWGGGMHTRQEFMLKESYDQRLSLNVALVKFILGDK